MDERLVGLMRRKHLHTREIRMLPEGGGWLLVELAGDMHEEALGRAHALADGLRAPGETPSVHLFEDPPTIKRIWGIRESSVGAAVSVPGEPDTWPGWEDAAVPPERVGAYLRDFRGLVERHGYRAHLYGHFGDGCIHCRIDFDLVTAEGIGRWRSFLGEAADLVVGYGGSLSGEHGDGHARAELLPRMFGEELVGAFRQFKSLWDPGWKMNPGKVVGPYRMDEGLRLGAHRSPRLATHFSYPEDEGSFARATLRCIGVGACRRTDSGTMCPSYMATREERHSTRGRARMLFEMLAGEPVRGGWRDRDVKESLELCLSCKGCKSDCPARVDMATYKAEFASHYYRGRLRPLPAYSLGLIHWWARLAAHAPRAANLILQTPRLSEAVKRLGGVAPERPAPRFALRTFREWFEARQPRREGDRPVLLWPDTFSNFFRPQVAAAAVGALEEADYRVSIPSRVLCCGRPLFDYGMLPTARRLLRRVLEVMSPEIEAGVPIVGLEPSCVAVFRDELTDLLPDDPAARRLSGQVHTLSELLDREGYRPPRLARPAVVHLHCHQRAVLGVEADQRLLEALGLDYEILDSGCCGLAGSFGFERGERYRVSVRVGERVLIPAIRAAPRRRSSWRTGSPAGLRSSTSPAGEPCTWRRCCGWHRWKVGR
jgi:Fe-S oxidoreductase